MEYPPHSIIAALRADDMSPVVGSETIWLCVSCFACSQVCPAQIPIANGLMATLKHEQSEEGLVDAVDAIAILGKKEHQAESMVAILDLMKEHGKWPSQSTRVYRASPSSAPRKLAVALGDGLRTLFSGETIAAVSDRLEQGSSLERYRILTDAYSIPGGSRTSWEPVFAVVREMPEKILPSVFAAARDDRGETRTAAYQFLSAVHGSTPGKRLGKFVGEVI